ncbi:aldo/keto reductase [uncultured Roseobacter sp.]|uniref:aldo/keto reductase n=1 Tax=uncultured Roseobacter sp. TaxID=114847 RepID=UPI002624C3B1|nr:aldo/keto reductase [uncultured Roseobacter sp.]
MNFLDQEIAPLGMGCWPIGGAMFTGDQPLGYANSDDAESIRTIHAALDAGITLFDTAAAYGAGHAERLLARALKDRPDAMLVTKIGITIDETSKQLSFEDAEPETVLPAIDACLSRLQRDRIDLMLLHQNGLAVDRAEAVFDEMEKARAAGKIRSYGWSTDFAESASALAKRKHFTAVQHAMNVFVDAPDMQQVADRHDLTALIRSPLAMGLLSGKYGKNDAVSADDIRATDNLMIRYFEGAKANPAFLTQLEKVRELLMSDGRSLVQGAICWLWAKNDRNVPIPGARTVEQITGIAGALAFGPLPELVMAEIEQAIERDQIDTNAEGER